MKVLVTDVGGTGIKYAVMDENCTFYQRGTVRTPYENGAEGFVETIRSIYLSVKMEKGSEEIQGIAMCLPGLIDSERGICISGGTLEYNIGQPIAEMISRVCGVPVIIENDGKSAVWAEYWQGALKGHRSGMVMAIGTALAGGILIDGKVLNGPHFSAGELSYLCSNPSKWSEAEGTAGTSCSAVGFIKQARKALGRNCSGEEVFEEIRRRNPLVIPLWKAFLRSLCIQIYNMQITLDPEVIALGGGISRQSILLEDIRKEMDLFFREGRWTAENTFLPRPKIVLCKFGNDSNLLGALYHYIVHFQA